ncbi:probable serine/threonine-protein kinase At1g54610 isoform X2 [Asparagus officinalis]|nr:probable serine/threonine-protein kinase At1g54610 isoform X2 [Asparagus officinalis]
MGCASSKAAVSSTPPFDSNRVLGNLEGGLSREILAGSLWNGVSNDKIESGESRKVSSVNGSSNLHSFRLGNLYRYIEGEQAAAGWPTWLSNVAKEAIHGWVPLKAESYEKLEKIGQGTYSSVFKARDLDTGKIVALKKVRFDNYEPESVRFMAREIMILRRLNHPNVVKLEGIITARLSSSIYLVFEYMEHDLAGLSSAPDIKFSASQVKCYMHQLLSGLEHCHSNGVMHRDIKCSNLLVNNEGILKMADFGLANFFKSGRSRPLTSRVVTLWYRPPELLLGSTNYEPTVDLWSVGCVFAELFLGKPILQGRTEVEQIHKIFKLCGSPPEDYWTKSKLPHSAVFKPHQSYSKCLHDSFNYLPEPTFKLLEKFLSLEPYKRGTAKSALSSEYFKSKPYACEPSSLPKYSPHKEIDAKIREEAQRKKPAAGRQRGLEVLRRPSRTHSTGNSDGQSKLTAQAEGPWIKNCVSGNITEKDSSKENSESRLFVDLQPKPMINIPNEDLYSKHKKEEGHPFSGPLISSNASGLLWAVKQKETQSFNRSQANGNAECHEDSKIIKPHESEKQAMLSKWIQLDQHDSINGSAVFHHWDVNERYKRSTKSSKHQYVELDSQHHSDRVAFSGQFLSRTNNVDELLEKHERHMRQAVRRSWLRRG